MITIHIPALGNHSSEYRRGDTQVIYDSSKKCIVIDGGKSELKESMLAFLRSMGLTHVTVILTHSHGDHYSGVNGLLSAKGLYVDCIYMPDPQEIKSGYPDGYKALEYIRKKATSLKHPVYYPKADAWTDVTVGEIKARLWRQKYNGADKEHNNTTRVNNTSICAYFPGLKYFTTGDSINPVTGNFISLLKKSGYPVKWMKLPHHGNALNKTNAATLKALGCEFAWYNDIEPGGTIGKTRFTKTGARNAAANYTTWASADAINVTADGGRLTVKSGSKSKTIILDAAQSDSAAANPADNTVSEEISVITANLPEIALKSTGMAVTVWQIILTDAGISTKIDGDFGSKTKSATKKYQSAHPECGGADGVVGQKTWTSGLSGLEK